MTSKDLNLSLDQALFQGRTEKKRQSQAPAPGRISRITAEQSAPPGHRKRSDKPLAKPRASRQWLVVSCVAVANMLFLLLAGIWLSGNTYYATAPYNTAPAETSADIVASLAQVTDRLNTLEIKLENLQLSLDRQQLQKPVESENSSPPVNEQPPASPSKIDDTPVADSGEPSSVQVKVKPWHVNLGNFDSREAAAATQYRVAAIGHRAEISPPASEGTGYQVILPGFSDRESAEFAANQIMLQTDLNGLWVGESHR